MNKLLIILIISLLSSNIFAFAAVDSNSCHALSGAWKNAVLGKLVTLQCSSESSLKIATYHVTEISTVLQQEPSNLFEEDLNKIHLISKNQLDINGDMYFRTSNYPEIKPKSPATAFENCQILAEYFHQHYGFFKLRNVDYKNWREQCYQVESLDPLGDDFLHVLSNMLNQFGDNHIVLAKSLAANKLDYFGFTLRNPFAKLLNDEAKRFNQEHITSLSDSDYVDEILIPDARNYFIQQINPAYSSNNVSIFWGPLKTNEKIIYLYIQSMNVDKDEQDELRLNLEKMIKYVKRYHIEKIIIDLRFNQGGDDTVSQLMMSYFFHTKSVAYWQKTFYKYSRWTEAKAIVVNPAEIYISDTPIILLVGPITASAAECFALGLSSLPNVKIIGDNTMGIFSDQFPRRLANGWWVTLSNQKLLSANKKISYEKIGLPVSEKFSFPFLSILNAEGDIVLQKANEI